MKSKNMGKGERLPDYRLKSGVNDLETLYPDIAAELVNELNDGWVASNITIGSSKRLWWKCPNGHIYQTVVNYRTGGSQCPYCTNKKLLVGFNDLASVCSDLAKEWNSDKNMPLSPANVIVGSHQKVWWRCKYGHEWMTSVGERTATNGRATSCPVCQKNKRTSNAEQICLYTFKQFFSDTVSRNSDVIGQEVDIWIPSKRVAIEYDSLLYHSEKFETEKQKNNLCSQKDIRLIRIREEGLKEHTNCECYFVPVRLNFTCLDLILKRILSSLGVQNLETVNTEKNYLEIKGQMQLIRKGDSVADRFPELVKEWGQRNPLDCQPDNISFSSTKKVWWKCSKCGHEWKSSVNNRTISVAESKGCPNCARLIKKYDHNHAVPRAVVCIDTGEYFSSVKEAANEKGIALGSITQVCKGRNKTGGELRWRYATREEVRRHGGPLPAGKNSKLVRDLDTGIVYGSGKEAAKALQVSTSGVSNVCLGRIKHIKGHRLEYIEKQD